MHSTICTVNFSEEDIVIKSSGGTEFNINDYDLPITLYNKETKSLSIMLIYSEKVIGYFVMNVNIATIKNITKWRHLSIGR